MSEENTSWQLMQKMLWMILCFLSLIMELERGELSKPNLAELHITEFQYQF